MNGFVQPRPFLAVGSSVARSQFSRDLRRLKPRQSAPNFFRPLPAFRVGKFSLFLDRFGDLHLASGFEPTVPLDQLMFVMNEIFLFYVID